MLINLSCLMVHCKKWIVFLFIFVVCIGTSTKANFVTIEYNPSAPVDVVPILQSKQDELAGSFKVTSTNTVVVTGMEVIFKEVVGGAVLSGIPFTVYKDIDPGDDPDTSNSDSDIVFTDTGFFSQFTVNSSGPTNFFLRIHVNTVTDPF